MFSVTTDAPARIELSEVLIKAEASAAMNMAVTTRRHVLHRRRDQQAVQFASGSCGWSLNIMIPISGDMMPNTKYSTAAR